MLDIRHHMPMMRDTELHLVMCSQFDMFVWIELFFGSNIHLDASAKNTKEVDTNKSTA